MPSLEVVIGLLTIILFYSLLATVVMELISSFGSFRANHLIKVLKSILASSDQGGEGSVFKKFQDNVLYQQLAGKFFGKGKGSPPSYMEAKTFRSVLLKIIEQTPEGKTTIEKVRSLSDQNLSKLLEQLWEEADEHIEDFAAKIEQWYDEIMDRASGWYKRRIKFFLMLIGFGIAFTFNVDTLSVYHNLVSSSSLELNQLTTLATSISNKELFIPTSDSLSDVSVSDSALSINREVYELVEENLRDLRSPLGIGWENAEPPSGLYAWISKFFGWLITAICISKGAPFWFDLLRKVVNFRETGNVPVKALISRPSARATRTEKKEINIDTGTQDGSTPKVEIDDKGIVG